MPSGTPQGGVCSPILFNLFLHDIPTGRDVNTIQYADDTSLYCVGDDVGRVRNSLNIHLIRVSRFFADWKLFLNGSKTEVVVFMGFAREAHRTTRRAFRNLVLMLNGVALRPKIRVRFLGVILNRNNRFVRHVDDILALARRSFYALRPILRSSLICPRVKTNVYKLYIRPILVYASAIWARPICISAHQMERLRGFERRILRHSANAHREIGTYMYARDSDLYRLAECPRIDVFIVQKAIGFFNRCHTSVVLRIQEIVRRSGERIFKSLSYFWHRAMGNELYENGKLLEFNRAYNDPARSVYSTGQ